jgi:hypothetical protein
MAVALVVESVTIADAIPEASGFYALPCIHRGRACIFVISGAPGMSVSSFARHNTFVTGDERWVS